MIPELGSFALILALLVAIPLSIFPLLGANRQIPGWIAMARPAARLQALLMIISFAALTYAFVTNDFSVRYVAANSNSQLPLIYRVSAVWGGHEGSLLLWGMILSIWAAMVSFFSRSVPEDMVARVLAVMGMISVGFLLFMLMTSNPFLRLLPAAAEGRDLNPLLQDLGLALHPTMLYMGYVGFSVAFAFAIAAMLGGQLDAAWTRWSRPWTNIAWVFLTLGIVIGSWWAYYELGWGGWWFWDPVENASFMPWLVGTALIHSMAVTEKRGLLKSWTVLLAVFTFSLSLLGTFLVRSGVLTSVHAFASDPRRGIFILVFLALVVGGSLLLYAIRAPQIRSRGTFSLTSREAALLLNNILLVTVAASVLLGTLYPLVLDALGLGKISVGPPYFNSVFVPLTLPLGLLIGIGILSRWKRDRAARLFAMLRWHLVASLAVGLILPLFLSKDYQWRAALGLSTAVWVALSNFQGMADRNRYGKSWLRVLRTTPQAWYGMLLAHIGVAVFIAGVTVASIYSMDEDVRLAPGDSYTLAGYKVQFDTLQKLAGPNYSSQMGTFTVRRDGKLVATLHPEKRTYVSSSRPTTEAGIDAGLWRDFYVAMGEPIGDSGAWAIRLYYKPLVRWLWFGGLFMALGGLLAAFDRRYRLARRVVPLELKATATPSRKPTPATEVS
ncbi:MAG TPA: heme lyase CcmF/NrfE family subunit [Gammaproteobacteria bacterium]|nr:heme lyase CcmF/NrfE family subunit [Gammaproteobacteria bacterium]